MKKTVLTVIFVLSAAFVFNGCGESSTGKVATDGSTSMERVIGALGEAFEAEYTDYRFTFNPTGSGSGITAVKEGRCDIGLSSRSLKESEKRDGLTETVLAYDGIAVVVNPENTITDIAVQTVAAIYMGEFVNWKELGGADAPIVIVGREAGSGTRDGFESVTGTVDACRYRQELTSAGDVLTTVSTNPHAIGYTSTAAVKNNVKALKIGGVTPTDETIRDGTYVLRRPFVLVTKDKVELSEAAQRFFDFTATDKASEIILMAGAVPEK